MAQHVRKRYIAGAECPECGAIDKIYVTMSDESGPMSRHCNRCGYEELQGDKQGAADTSKKERAESDWQTVRIQHPHKK